MCPFDDQLVDHFDWVMNRRKEKYSGNSSDDEGSGMVSNEYAVGRGDGR